MQKTVLYLAHTYILIFLFPDPGLLCHCPGIPPDLFKIYYLYKDKTQRKAVLEPATMSAVVNLSAFAKDQTLIVEHFTKKKLNKNHVVYNDKNNTHFSIR